MDKVELSQNLKRLGFVMMETKEDFDVNETLSEAVKSKDMRVWEGFPVLLVSAAQEYGFDYEQILKHLTNNQDKENFRALLLLSLTLYQYFHLSFLWANQLKKNFSTGDLATMQELKKKLTRDEFVLMGDTRFSADRLKTMFNNYFEKDAKKTTGLKEKYEELSLEYALSQLFSPKQKDLFKKKLCGDVLTKTEREYYSRTVKKKVSALANPELNRLAQKLMDY